MNTTRLRPRYVQKLAAIDMNPTARAIFQSCVNLHDSEGAHVATIVQAFELLSADNVRNQIYVRRMGASLIPHSDKQYALSAALDHLNDFFKHIHDGKIGHIYVQPESPFEYHVVAATPYPFAFIEGLLMALIQNSDHPHSHLSSDTIARTFSSFVIRIPTKSHDDVVLSTRTMLQKGLVKRPTRDAND